jgi:hypothetical protein
MRRRGGNQRDTNPDLPRLIDAASTNTIKLKTR